VLTAWELSDPKLETNYDKKPENFSYILAQLMRPIKNSVSYKNKLVQLVLVWIDHQNPVETDFWLLFFQKKLVFNMHLSLVFLNKIFDNMFHPIALINDTKQESNSLAILLKKKSKSLFSVYTNSSAKKMCIIKFQGVVSVHFDGIYDSKVPFFPNLCNCLNKIEDDNFVLFGTVEARESSTNDALKGLSNAKNFSINIRNNMLFKIVEGLPIDDFFITQKSKKMTFNDSVNYATILVDKTKYKKLIMEKAVAEAYSSELVAVCQGLQNKGSFGCTIIDNNSVYTTARTQHNLFIEKVYSVTSFKLTKSTKLTTLKIATVEIQHNGCPIVLVPKGGLRQLKLTKSIASGIIGTRILVRFAGYKKNELGQETLLNPEFVSLAGVRKQKGDS